MPRIDSVVDYNTTYHWMFESQRAALLKTFDVATIKKALGAADVLGISHYAPAPSKGVSPGVFEMPMDTAAYELAHWGIDFRVRPGGGRGGEGCARTGSGGWR
jgi:hypothetical protein